jgi:hypothetical protein
MVICKSTTHAYYPMSSRLPDLIRGSGRVRYVRGFLLTNPKGSGAIVGARVVGRRNERTRDECPGIELTSWD